MNRLLAILILISTVLLFSCSRNDDSRGDTDNSCYVQLFDGDNFTDDNIIVKGPGEFSALNKLPGVNKNWDDEADSFKSGKNTTVTFYTESDFKGDSVTYKDGAQEASIDEPGSMKITCK